MVLATERTIPAGSNPEQFIEADNTRVGANHIIKTHLRPAPRSRHVDQERPRFLCAR